LEKFKKIYEEAKPVSLEYYSYDVPANYYFNRKREKLIKSFIRKVISLNSINFLDVGCGDGYYLKFIEQNYKHVFSIGVDISSSQLKHAKRKIKVKSNLIVASATNLPFKDSSFEVVLCSEVVEHIPDVTSTLKELARVCKSKLIISTPTLTAPFIRFELNIAKKLGRPGKWGKTHIREFKQNEFLSLLINNNLRPILIKATPFIYFPLIFKLLSLLGLPFAKLLYVTDSIFTQLLPFLQRLGIVTVTICKKQSKV